MSFKSFPDKLLPTFTIFVLALALSACTNANLECQDEIGCVDLEPNEPIHLVYLLATSGDAAFLGVDTKRAVEIAIEDREFLLDHPLILTGENSGCSGERGRTAAEKIVADSATIVGVIGTSCSDAARAAIPLISDAGLVMISPSNTDPDLTDAETSNGEGWQASYFRTAHNNLRQAQIAAQYSSAEMGANTAAVIHDGSDYSVALQQAFVSSFRQWGGVVTLSTRAANSAELVEALDEVAAVSPDVLYLPLFEPEANFVTNRLSEIAGLERVGLIGSDSLFVKSFVESSGTAVEGMYLVGPAVKESAAHDVFLDKWRARFGSSPPGAFHAHAYDATNLLLNAIEKVAQVADNDSLLIGRKALRDAIAATTNFDGLTGQLTCNQSGDCASRQALGIYQVTEAEIAEGHWPPPLVWQP